MHKSWLKLRVGPTWNGGHGLLWNAQVIKVKVYEYAWFCSESTRETFQHNIQKSCLIRWLLIKAREKLCAEIFGLAKCKLDTVEPYAVWSALCFVPDARKTSATTGSSVPPLLTHVWKAAALNVNTWLFVVERSTSLSAQDAKPRGFRCLPSQTRARPWSRSDRKKWQRVIFHPEVIRCNVRDREKITTKKEFHWEIR